MKGNWTRVREARGARENPQGKRGLEEGLKERVEEFTKTRHFPRVRGAIKGEERGRQWIETATLTRAAGRGIVRGPPVTAGTCPEPWVADGWGIDGGRGRRLQGAAQNWFSKVFL